MNEIAARDVNKIIELHNYCINVFEEDDGARSALIRMLHFRFWLLAAHLSDFLVWDQSKVLTSLSRQCHRQAPTTMCSLLSIYFLNLPLINQLKDPSSCRSR
ncbi:unnamed protein product [Brassica rapa subsp. narinosa]